MLPRTLITALITASITAAASAIPITTFQRKHIAPGVTQAANDIVQTSDGGYMYVGTRYISFSRREVTLTRTNSIGQPLWCSSFGVGPVRAEGLSIIQSPDGGFVLGCTTENAVIADNRIMLIKVDSFGNVTAARAYDGLQFGNVRNATGGGYMIAGSRNNAQGFGPAVLIRTDSNLNQVAGVKITQPVDPNGTSTSLIFYDLAEDRDGGFYVVGRRDLGGNSSRSLVMKIRGPLFPLGTILWANDYFAQHSGFGSALSVTRDFNGDAIVAANISNSTNPSFNTGICRVNSAGTRIWANLYSSGSPNSGITLPPNGHPVVTLSLAPQDCGIMSVNGATGGVLWGRRFGNTFDNDSLRRVIPTTDGGYASAGFQSSAPMIYKHDAQGWTGCNQFQFNPALIPSNQTVAIALATAPLGPDCQVFLSHDIVALGDEPLCFSQRCPGDYNTDMQVDFFDYLDFVSDFSIRATAADFNVDGEIDFFDYLDFVAAFVSPC
jgi:hypothetical protein